MMGSLVLYTGVVDYGCSQLAENQWCNNGSRGSDMLRVNNKPTSLTNIFIHLE